MSEDVEVSVPALPSPESTRRASVPGIPVVLADGRTWVIASVGLEPAFDATRDYLFSVGTAFGVYDGGDDLNWAQQAVMRLLQMAHSLDDELAFVLVRDAEPEALFRAAESSLLGNPERGWEYSVWARGTLRANGIDPLALEPDDIRPTLLALEAMGKALPRKLIPAAKMAERRSSAY